MAEVENIPQISDHMHKFIKINPFGSKKWKMFLTKKFFNTPGED